MMDEFGLGPKGINKKYLHKSFAECQLVNWIFLKNRRCGKVLWSYRMFLAILYILHVYNDPTFNFFRS